MDTDTSCACKDCKKNNIPRETVEFMPDALEIKNEKLPWSIKIWGVWGPVIVVVTAILWASIAETDVTVRATGKLVSDQQTITMKPYDRIVIKSVKVRVGDIVKPNQLLIEFDPTIYNTDVERLGNEEKAYKAQLKRLRSEFTNTDFKADRADQFELWQQAIYDQRQEYYREKIRYYDESVSQVVASKKASEDSLAKQEERLEKVKVLENMFEGLYNKKATSLKEYIQMSMDRMSMEANVDELRNKILELNHQYGSTLASKNSFIQEWRNQISEDMVDIARKLASNNKEYEKAQRLADYVCLRSPCEAMVHEIASLSSGSAVREAEAVITLVPLDGTIELEAELRPQDIGRVKKGSKAKIKLSAYPFQKYGTLEGEVKNISENTFQHENNATAAMSGSMTYYRARLSVSGKLRNLKPGFRLIPGMETETEITVGHRRVIEYIIYPLIKALDESAREP